MNEEDEEIRLRDKLALAIIPSIIDRFTAYFNKPNSNGTSGKAWIVREENEEEKLSSQFHADAKFIAEMSYKIADEMRKARLKTFT
jgi:hypothetical protein